MSMRYPGGLIATTPVNQQYPSGVWTGPQTTPYQTNNVWGVDSSFKNTTLLLHGDGATTPFIKDASTNNFQLSLVGDTKPNNLTPFITNGYWSNYFDGTTDYLNTPSNAAFGMGTGDFTVETWIYFTAAQAEKHITDSNASGGLFLKTNATNVGIGRAMIGEDTMFSYSFSQNVWYHIAFSRSGSTVYGFVNGTQIGSATNTNSYATGACYVGAASDGSRSVNGYISNLRIVKGTAVYTSAFTPPTTPLTAITNTSLLTCQSNRFIDNSTNAFTITPNGNTAVSMQQPFTAPSGTSQYGSGYFDGSGDAIYSASQATTFGTGDFTLEFWVYFSAVNNSTVKYLYDMRNSGATTASFLAQEASNAWTFWNGAGSTLTTGFTSSTFAATTWNHVAICRSSGVTKFFVNGTQTGSVADTSNYANSTLTVGTRYTFSDGLNGYISNLRIVNGTAVYTAAFTPSTTPLTAVTNTSLLTLQTNGPENNNGFLDSSLNSFPITRNGNTTQGSFTPYEANGYWSNFFGGAGNYMTTPSGSATTIVGTINSSLNLCIECWIYLNEYSGSSSFPALIGNMDPTAESDDWSFGPVSTGALMFYWFEGGQRRASTTSTIPLNAWTHVAVNISTGVITLFINGVSQTLTGTTTLTTGSVGRNYLTLGQWNNGVSGSFGLFKGYVSNLRVIKASTYTANFTPSTAPLTAIANTSLLISQSNRFIDNSANAFTLTVTGSPSVQAFQPFAPTVQYTPSTLGGSGYFDGSGDYLSVANNGLFGAGNWTFECWVNAPVGQTDKSIIDTRNSASGSGTTTGFTVTMITSTEIRLWSGSERIRATANYVNQWLHIAVVKNSTTTTMYFNGISVGTTTALGDMSDTSFLVAAGYYGSTSIGAYGNFYASNMRVVKGSAVYTANFTPPAAPVTAITNTALLMNYTNAAIFDNSGMNNLETVGNAQVNTGVVKYGTSSMYFDGTGDQLYSISSQSTAFGTGDFTIEFWVNGLSSASRQDWLDLYNGTVGNRIQILWVSSQIAYYQNNTFVTGGGVYSTNTWYHIALSRASGSNRLFVNGVQVGTTASNTTNFNANAIYIGKSASGGTDFNGYMDDIRITAGVARYVTNFTPPVARMPNQ